MLKSEKLMVSVGQLSNRKNHRIIIKSLSGIKKENIKYLIIGDGENKKRFKKLTQKLDLEDKVIFAGYRKDIKNILLESDFFAFPSKQEGLPVSLMEAMSSGLPVICSDIRGNNELIKNGHNGYLFKPNDVKGFREGIKNLQLLNKEHVKEFNERVIRKFSKENVNKIMFELFSNIESDTN